MARRMTPSASTAAAVFHSSNDSASMGFTAHPRARGVPVPFAKERRTADSPQIDKAVPDPAHGVEITRGPAELIPQASHVGIHSAGINEIIVFPDITKECLAGLHPST